MEAVLLIYYECEQGRSHLWFDTFTIINDVVIYCAWKMERHKHGAVIEGSAFYLSVENICNYSDEKPNQMMCQYEEKNAYTAKKN